MTTAKTHPTWPETTETTSSAWNDTLSEDGLQPSAPLSLYLSKLLDPNIRTPEPLEQPPASEQNESTEQTVSGETAWQKARNAAKTLRATGQRRQRKSDGSSPVEIKAKSRPRRKPKKRAAAENAGGARQKVMMALIPLLGVTLVFLVKNPLKVSPVAPVQAAPATVETAVPAADIEIAWEIPPLYPSGGRDPMRLPTSPVVPTSTAEVSISTPASTRVDLVVTGILYSEDRPAAIVDTQVVHEGEQVSGATVTRIERNGVEFEKNGRTWKQTVETK